jgi:hypothetical protein
MTLIYPGSVSCRVCHDNIPDDGGYSTAVGIEMKDGVDWRPLCGACADAMQSAREYAEHGEVYGGVELEDIAHLRAALLRDEFMGS